MRPEKLAKPEEMKKSEEVVRVEAAVARYRTQHGSIDRLVKEVYVLGITDGHSIARQQENLRLKHLVQEREMFLQGLRIVGGAL